MAPRDLFDTELPPTFNLLKKKKKKCSDYVAPKNEACPCYCQQEQEPECLPLHQFLGPDSHRMMWIRTSSSCIRNGCVTGEDSSSLRNQILSLGISLAELCSRRIHLLHWMVKNLPFAPERHTVSIFQCCSLKKHPWRNDLEQKKRMSLVTKCAEKQ